MKYKIKPPLGSIIMPKDVMTEKELRKFMPTIIGDTEYAESWKEKAEKDPIEDIVDWLKRAGYEVTEIE